MKFTARVSGKIILEGLRDAIAPSVVGATEMGDKKDEWNQACNQIRTVLRIMMPVEGVERIHPLTANGGCFYCEVRYRNNKAAFLDLYLPFFKDYLSLIYGMLAELGIEPDADRLPHSVANNCSFHEGTVYYHVAKEVCNYLSKLPHPHT